MPGACHRHALSRGQSLHIWVQSVSVRLLSVGHDNADDAAGMK